MPFDRAFGDVAHLRGQGHQHRNRRSVAGPASVASANNSPTSRRADPASNGARPGFLGADPRPEFRPAKIRPAKYPTTSVTTISSTSQSIQPAQIVAHRHHPITGQDDHDRESHINRSVMRATELTKADQRRPATPAGQSLARQVDRQTHHRRAVSPADPARQCPARG